MDEKKHPLGFEFKDGCVVGELKHGMSIEGVVQKHFVMREAMVADLLSAEMEADVSKPLNFSAQLMLLQLVSIGSFKGPFTEGMIRRLRTADWRLLRAAQAEVEGLGEDEAASEPES